MYAQLGNTVFDGLKSFVSFSQDGDVVLVEHALIGRKPRLQPSGLNLETVTLSLFLHQEYCNVELEIAKLITSRDTFEILPLLWGNGKIEGNFVIKQLTRDKIQQDELGNTYASVVTVILKECANDNRLDQAQQDAQKNAFAVGKKSSTKSNRKNPDSCALQISNLISVIRSSADTVNRTMGKFNRAPLDIVTIDLNCKNIGDQCSALLNATSSPNSCIFNNQSIRNSAINASASANGLRSDVHNFELAILGLKSENTILQAAVNSLIKAASPITAKAIVPS